MGKEMPLSGLISNSVHPQKLIIQVGRLDWTYRNKISFSFEGESGEADLTSSFLIHTKALKDAKQLIIFPKSIILQDNLLALDDPFIEMLKRSNVEEYLKAPETLLKDHPQAEDAELLIVSSLGSYSFQGHPYTFDSSLDIITLQIYLHLVAKFSTDDLQELYLDISSGQNIYIAALINAIYRFLPYIKFKRFLHETNEKIEAYLLNSDPIIGKPPSPIKIQKSQFSAKAFNEFFYKDSEKLTRLVSSIFKKEDYREDLEKFLGKDYFLLHGALIYGFPLMLTLSDPELLKRLFDKVGMNRIANQLRDFYANDNTDSKFPKFSFLDVFACTFALAIGQSIYGFFKEIIQKVEIDFNLEGNVDKEFSPKNTAVDNAFTSLRKVYSQPGLNYKSEIINYVKKYLAADKHSSEFVSFSELMKISAPDYKSNKNFDPRNYFAHGGLEQNITEMNMTDGKVRIRYNSEVALRNRDCIIKYMKK